MRFDAQQYHLPLYPFVIDLFIQVAERFFCAGNFMPLNCRKNKVDVIFQKKNQKQT